MQAQEMIPLDQFSRKFEDNRHHYVSITIILERGSHCAEDALATSTDSSSWPNTSHVPWYSYNALSVEENRNVVSLIDVTTEAILSLWYP